jgi:hypothetical protein
MKYLLLFLMMAISFKGISQAKNEVVYNAELGKLTYMPILHKDGSITYDTSTQKVYYGTAGIIASRHKKHLKKKYHPLLKK